ncbi:MAG: type II toxin-antitoxin system Phd/YefM family antitoxin [Egibacteraceae bacterium]
MEVGIRELRDHLSRYLDRVRDGDELVVTDRGRAVARVIPISGERTFDRLVSEGLIEPAPVAQRRRPRRRVPAQGKVSDLVADQRR